MQQDLSNPSEVTAHSIWPNPPPSGKPIGIHQHTDVEFTVYERGPTTMFYGGRKTRVPPNRLMVFWGAMPHMALEADARVVAHVLRVPLPVVLRWPLPPSFVHKLTHFDVLMEPPSRTPCSDLDLVKHWVQLINRRSPEAAQIVLLEVEARLRRIALDQCASSAVKSRPGAGVGRLERLVESIAIRCLGPLHISDVAREAGLTRSYATQLFHREMGMTMLEYITRQRVSHAQRLLVTTDHGILDIIEKCGLVSPTRFYAVFRRFAGGTPGQYRRQFMKPDSMPPKANAMEH